MVNGQNPNPRGERTLTLLSPRPQEAQHSGLGLSRSMAARPAVCSCGGGLRVLPGGRGQAGAGGRGPRGWSQGADTPAWPWGEQDVWAPPATGSQKLWFFIAFPVSVLQEEKQGQLLPQERMGRGGGWEE